MLTVQEQQRYSRQIMVGDIGEQGQLALRNATVLIVGMGGLGNPVSLYLAAAGVGKLIIADDDTIDISNLPRQILFSEADVEQSKVETAAQQLQQHNSDIDIEVVDEKLDQELGDYYLEQVDLVIDCTDNIAARYLMNELCLKHQKPLIIGAASGFNGQQLVIDPRKADSACYQCLFPKSEKAPVNNCQTIGIIGPVLSIVAGMQALQAIKLLTNNPVQINQLNMFDGLLGKWQHFSLPKQNNCPACGSHN